MLIEDKEGMVKKITESIQETLSERLSDQASDELAKKIAAKEKLLVKAVKNAQTADDLISGERERELLINEIESLKQEQKKRSLQVVDLEHTNERFQALWGMVAEKGKLTEFDGDMFRKIVNRVTVDGKELTYDFGCGITITDSIE